MAAPLAIQTETPSVATPCGVARPLTAGLPVTAAPVEVNWLNPPPIAVPVVKPVASTCAELSTATPAVPCSEPSLRVLV